MRYVLHNHVDGGPVVIAKPGKHTVVSPPWKTMVKCREQTTEKPSVAVASPSKAGFASTQTEVNASAKDTTTSEVSAVCTVRCTVGIPESQFLG